MPPVPRSAPADAGLSKALSDSLINGSKRSEPVWKGPEIDGVTQSLLGRFLCCRERFRLLVVEGLKPKDHFNNRIEYGNLWHICEKALAGYIASETSVGGMPPWGIGLIAYAETLYECYPMSRTEIQHYVNICATTFPLYIEHWSKHPDVKNRTTLMQEQEFKVPYKLPSGRVVLLRGKWDSVDLIGIDEGAGIYLQENKTKGTIDAYKIGRQLAFDLQTCFYLVALQEDCKTWNQERLQPYSEYPILGVRYNVIRRSMHKLTGKDGNYDNFNSRLAGMIHEKPEEWFARWKVEVTPADIQRFQRECLDPVLENLVDWYDEMCPPAKQSRPPNYHTPINWRFPNGIYNPMTEGGESEVDEYLESGSMNGLQRTDNLFPELS